MACSAIAVEHPFELIRGQQLGDAHVESRQFLCAQLHFPLLVDAIGEKLRILFPKTPALLLRSLIISKHTLLEAHSTKTLRFPA